MNDNNKGSTQSYSLTFLALAGTSIAGIIGGLYYFYTLFKDEPEISDEVEHNFEEIQETIQTGKELTTDVAIKIIATVNKIAEDIMKSKKPDLDARRREQFNNEEEYEKLVYEFLECKEVCYNQATSVVLNKFNISMQDLQMKLSTVPPYEIEKKLLECEKPSFDESNKDISKETTKQAFIYYANKFITQMGEMGKMFQRIDPSQQDFVMFKLISIKTKVDDELWFKYQINENQMRYKIHEFKLYEDFEVKQLQNKIMAMDQHMGMG